MMIPCAIAPFRNLCDYLQRKRLTVWKLHRAFACLVLRQTVGEMLHSLIAGVQPDVLFERRKMDDVVFSPVSRHAQIGRAHV